MGEEKVKDEVQEMLKSFGSELAEESKEESVEQEQEEVIEDVEEEEETSDEEIESETEEAQEEDPSDTEEEEEEDERDKVIAELRKKLDEKEAEKEEEQPEEEAPVETPIQFEPQEFISEDDLEDIYNDPKVLNNMLNKVYQKAVSDTRKVLGEGVLRSIPDIVRTSVNVMDKLKKMNDKFYTDNKDLTPFKKVVATVFEEIATKHPGKDMMELLTDVAKESRKRLELYNEAAQPNDRKSPRLPRRKRRTTLPKDKPNTDPLLSELGQMNTALRR